MSDTSDNKICPLCAETIKAAAKVCPYCRKAQTRRSFWAVQEYLPFLLSLVFAVLIAFIVQLMTAPRQYSQGRDKIEVVSAGTELEELENETNVVIFGVLTNGGSYAWSGVELEVRFIDGAGKVMDADSVNTDFKIMSHSDRVFRVTMYSTKAIPSHAKIVATVRSAAPTDTWLGIN